MLVLCQHAQIGEQRRWEEGRDGVCRMRRGRLACQADVLTWSAPHQYGDGFGATLRLHIGLEDVEDLIDDLEQAFHAMLAANR